MARFKGWWLSILLLMMVMQSVPPTPAAAQIPVRLWHSWTGDAAQLLTTWIEEYQERTPSIAIEAEYVPLYALRQQFTRTPNAARPDVFFAPSDWGGDLYANALVAALDVKINAEQRALALDTAWETLLYNEKTVGIPIAMEGLTLYYNRTLVAAENVPTTWAELLDSAAAATDTLGLLIGSGFYPTAGIYLALGGRLIDERGANAMDSKAALTAYLTRMKELYDRSGGKIQIGVSSSEFRAGRSLFALDGSWQFSFFRGTLSLGDNLGVARLPMVDGKAWQPLFRTTALYVSASSSQIDAALSFSRFITGVTAQTEMANAFMIPTNPQATVADEQFAIMVAQMQTDGMPIRTYPILIDFWREMQVAIDNVAIRGVTPQQAAEALLRRFNPAAAS